MSDFGKLLIRRLEKAANRNQVALDNNRAASHKLDIVLPVLERDSEGNQIALAAIREVYSLLETDAEERQSTIVELKEAKDLLEKASTLLEQAGFDFANIQTFSNDEIWLADHLDTIKRFVAIVNLQKLEVALDEADNERFIDFAHAVKRSGDTRQAGAAGAAAVAAIEAIKVAIDQNPPAPAPDDPGKYPEGYTEAATSE